MLEIFKYFFGIIFILILTYVLIVIVRTVFVSGLLTTKEVINNPNTNQTIASTTVGAARAVSTFSLTSWLQNFRPFQYAPVDVAYDNTNSGSRFYQEDSFFLNQNLQRQLYWQNLNDAPNTHPTDYVPLTFDQRWGGGRNNSQTQESEATDYGARLIFINLKDGEKVVNKQVITGSAHISLFENRNFPVYVFDTNGEVVGSGKMYINGDVNRNAFVPFRGTVEFETNLKAGYLLFKNTNQSSIGIKATKVVNVNFSYSNNNLPLLFPSRLNNTQCAVGGCRMNICGSQSEIANLVTTCEYKPSDACYKTAVCEFNTEMGRCAWRVDNTLALCLQNNF
jgi:hypothetical protein